MKKKKSLFVPQMGNWNTWDGEWGDFSIFPQNVKNSSMEKEEDYLKREEKIISLAKERLKMEDKTIDKFFEYVKPGPDCFYDFRKKLEKQFILLAKEGIEKLSCIEYDHIFKKLNISLIDRKYPDARIDVCLKTSKKGVNNIYLIEATDFKDRNYYYVCGDTGMKKRAGDTWVYRQGRGFLCNVVDIGEFFSIIYISKKVGELLKDESFDLSEIAPDLSNYFKVLGEEDSLPYLNLPIFGSKEAATEVLGNRAKNINSRNNKIIRLTYGRELIFPGATKSSSGNYYIGYVDYDYAEAMNKLFNLIAERIIVQKRNKSYIKTTNYDYAKSFQTKKNIPKKTLQAMKESKFNDFFGFVEFDEDVDLVKVSEIEKEFRSFNKVLYGEEKATKDVALRFRRLGNHKAAGLYYVAFNCICIDINNPHSFVHEYGHMLDFTNSKASEKKEFKKILISYEELIKKYIEDNKIELKGKYNLEYYLTPTEIFARTFEIYMKRIVGMDNSILGDCQGFAYPTSEIFEKQVSDYFTNFFILNNNVKLGGEEKCAST